jgi:class 3 adenylate cyclase
MFAFNRLSIQSKIQALLLIVCLVSILVISFLSWSWARAELKQNIFDHLTSVRASKAYQVESYFRTLEHHVETLCEDQMVVRAMQQFNQAYDRLNTTVIPDKWDTDIQTYYETEFFPRLAKNVAGIPGFATYNPETAAARYLQYFYVAHNAYPVGEKDALMQAEDDSEYSRVHAQYHALFRNLIKQFGYYDFFLIDAKAGEIVYSVYKETDFGTSLLDGPYRRSNLAAVVAEVRDNPDRGAIQIVDFKSYRPSYAAPAAFIAGPIYDGAQMVGILAVQMPVNEINAVLTGNQHWQQDGLGETGETYLVGADFLMRSLSRFLIEEPEAYLATLRRIGTSEAKLRLMQQLNTSILLQKVDTEAAHAAIGGKEGTQITQDYRGVQVLSSYAPLHLPSVEWAILSEMDLTEAFRPVYTLQGYLFVTTVLLILVITWIAIAVAANFVKPIKVMIAAASQIETGQSVEVPLQGQDELSELAHQFNQIAQRLHQQTELVHLKERENHVLLANLLPQTIAERLKKGESKIAEAIAQVTVLCAEVKGLSDLTQNRDIWASSDAMNEFVDMVNTAAERYGLEKLPTLSDRYVAVCGLTKPRLDQENRTLEFALKLIDQVQDFNRRHTTRLSLTIGIHSGPVMTGIIGTRWFTYEVWGETIAIATALSHQAVANSILVTQTVRDRLQDFYDFHMGQSWEWSDRTLTTWCCNKQVISDPKSNLDAQSNFSSEFEQEQLNRLNYDNFKNN